MRKIKEFKSSMRRQTKRLAELNVRLTALREQYKHCIDNAEKRHNLENEANQVKDEIAHIEKYLKKCNEAVYSWVDVDDKTINGLADFRYWGKT